MQRGLADAALAVKRRLGCRYRRAQRRLGHAAFERGLQSTHDPDVSSGFLYLRRGLSGYAVGPQDVFVDYGCGKGRVLLQAARLPFARVIGVEQNEADCAVARANLQAASARLRCGSFEVIRADATAWPLPDDVTYVYMFNPFQAEVFAGVLSRMLESLDRRPRPLTLIYANPTCARQLSQSGRFQLVRTSRGPRPEMGAQRIAVFRAVPAARPSPSSAPPAAPRAVRPLTGDEPDGTPLGAPLR